MALQAPKWMSRLLSPFQHGVLKPTGRALQLRLDTAKLYKILLSSQASNLPSRLTIPPPSEEEAPIANHLGLDALPPFSHQAAVIKYHLLISTRKILQETEASLTSSSSTALQDAFDFVPEIAPSTLESAGRGLFVNGTAAAGSMLAIYPGMSYLPSQLRHATRKSPSSEEHGMNSEELTPEESAPISDYAIARYDGVVIDGTAEISLTLENENEDASEIDTEKEAPEALTLHHPFANAHLINHPPEHTPPNALQFILDVDTASMSGNSARLTPVRPCEMPISRLEQFENRTVRQRAPGVEYFISNAPNERVLRTIALVALRDLKDEEIFMDYRFNPKVEAPDWYVSCGDGSQAVRRWYPRSLFSLS